MNENEFLSLGSSIFKKDDMSAKDSVSMFLDTQRSTSNESTQSGTYSLASSDIDEIEEIPVIKNFDYIN